MTRRDLLLASLQAHPRRSKLGIASTCYLSYRRLTDPFELLDHAASLGAAGIQAAVPKEPARFRAECERLGMYYEAMLSLKACAEETPLRLAREAGALCVRVACLSGRRYETFGTLEAWRKFVDESHAGLAAAVKAADRVRLPLAVENHKDWTARELPALLRKFSSEYLGACVDTGNNISLLDDPYELIEALAPFAVSTHIKDMGLAAHPDGFLLAEVPLGMGILDLPRVYKLLAKARPTLEMITRDPLLVPCKTDRYWVTFDAARRNRLGSYLSLTREKQQPLDYPSKLDPAGRTALEESNVRHCLRHS